MMMETLAGSSLWSVFQVIESTQELGNDLAGVMALQRKLTGMERDLVAIEDKLGDLGKEAERLASEHPEQSKTIKGRLAEITNVWDEMKVLEHHIRGLAILSKVVVFNLSSSAGHHEEQGGVLG